MGYRHIAICSWAFSMGCTWTST